MNTSSLSLISFRIVNARERCAGFCSISKCVWVCVWMCVNVCISLVRLRLKTLCEIFFVRFCLVAFSVVIERETYWHFVQIEQQMALCFMQIGVDGAFWLETILLSAFSVRWFSICFCHSMIVCYIFSHCSFRCVVSHWWKPFQKIFFPFFSRWQFKCIFQHRHLFFSLALSPINSKIFVENHTCLFTLAFQYSFVAFIYWFVRTVFNNEIFANGIVNKQHTRIQFIRIDETGRNGAQQK